MKKQSVRNNNFLKAHKNVCKTKCTSLYEKGIKQNQNMPMQTTQGVHITYTDKIEQL